MTADPAKTARERLEAALAATGAPDPRGLCREWMRRLRDISAEGYAKGLAFYQDRLVPSIASGEAEPLGAWRDYALLLAGLACPGRAVAVEAGGRSRPYEPPGEPDDMILHLPERPRDRPIVVAMPASPSGPQEAARAWLVEGRRAL